MPIDVSHVHILRLAVFVALPLSLCFHGIFASSSASAEEWPVVYETGFEEGAKDWTPTEKDTWKIKATDRGKVYSQYTKAGTYQPPHRSPHHISLVNDLKLTSFQIDVDVQSTHPDYGHRDACLFFGYQNPAHFYYVHLGQKTDDHANQIFIVNGADRTKISTKTTPGTPWDNKWHHVRIVRHTESGTIRIFFDDMETPVMEATDKHFVWGQIGLGSFDDTADWDNLVVRGLLKKQADE
jgi:hypothetical protein